jgi:dihydroorotate dehydrogenase (fumarate)
MTDLQTKYLGLTLKNPIVASSSPLAETLDGMRRLEEAGASAIVMPSLFEEQIAHEGRSLDHFLSCGSESYGEAVSYFPEQADFHIGPEKYLELVQKARASLEIPIIASLNGISAGGWTDWARLLEEAGAQALELNEYYIPTDPNKSGAAVEEQYLEVLQKVKGSVRIPVAVKLNPFFSSTANMCRKLVEAGADGLVLFNRFYQPDIDLESLEVVPKLVLSSSDELRLPLRWVAILYSRLKTDFAITSGVHNHADVLKAMMSGANVVMLASELLRFGVRRIGEILADTSAWMEEHEYQSIKQMQGSMSQQNVAVPAAFERANYMRALHSWRPDPTTCRS